MKIFRNTRNFNFSLIFIFFIIILTFTTCNNPGSNINSEQAVITINLGDSMRSIDIWPGNKPETLDWLVFDIELSGPTGVIEISGKGNESTITVPVSPGRWNIDIKALYEDFIFATGTNSTNVTAGQTSTVQIQMRPAETIFFAVANADDWEAVRNAITTGGNGRKYAVLINDSFTVPGLNPAAAAQDFTFGNAINITVDILGKENTLSLSSQGRFFNISSGQTVTIHNLKLVGLNDNTGSLVRVAGTFTMEGSSSISGNVLLGPSLNGGGVVIEGGTLIMKGNSEVYGNTARSLGGGVLINLSGSFIMEGNSKVYNNIANAVGGGGVSVGGNGTGIINFIMRENAQVFGNRATTSIDDDSSRGGGVFISDGSFTMEGNARVYKNEAKNNGGGVFVAGGSNSTSGGNLTMQGNASIYGNEAINGGGVYVTNGGTLTMQGKASVHDNTATGNNGGNGGGVYIDNGNFTMQDNASVHDNTAIGISNGGANGGGVYINNGGNLTMQDNASVYGNTSQHNSTANGGGVFVNIFNPDSGYGNLTMQDNASVYGNKAIGISAGGAGGGVFVNATAFQDGGIFHLESGVVVGSEGYLGLAPNISTDNNTASLRVQARGTATYGAGSTPFFLPVGSAGSLNNTITGEGPQ